MSRLALRPDETVIDVGCGTGLTFDQIERRIGPGGRLIGLEPSDEMLAWAKGRVANEGWQNVTLLEAAAEEARLPFSPDAAILVLTHDVMRSPRALANLVSQLRPGSRICAAGAKFAPAWAFPVNLAVRLIARPYVTTFDGMRRPWDDLERLVPDLRVESLALGGAYLAYGEVHAPGRAAPAGRKGAGAADARSADR